MPINRSLWTSLKKQHPDNYRDVYFGMETLAREGKKPGFIKGLRTATKEGHTLALGKTSAAKTAGKPTTNSNVLKNRRFLRGLRLHADVQSRLTKKD